MAQIADSDMKKALAELGGLDGGSKPTLRPEQVERITAIAKEGDPEVKAQKTAAMMDELLSQAEEGSRRLAALQAQLGLAPDQAAKFLGGERLSGDAKRSASEATSGFVDEVLAEAERTGKQALGQGKARASRPGRLRI